MRPSIRPSHFRTPRTTQEAFGPQAGGRIPRYHVDLWSGIIIVSAFILALGILAAIGAFISLHLLGA